MTYLNYLLIYILIKNEIMYKYYFNFRHNEKMECDLVKQHKKKKSSKKQNLSNQAIHIVNII